MKGLSKRWTITPFNSLYWDFCSASNFSLLTFNVYRCNFQFPLLGFLFCIKMERWDWKSSWKRLSIPFIGIFVLHQRFFDITGQKDKGLSIPFIGIFVLHLFLPLSLQTVVYRFQFPLLGFLFCITWRYYIKEEVPKIFQFPLLGFLFCIFLKQTNIQTYIISFNSLYWDFCSASWYNLVRRKPNVSYFQFPLLGFLFCITRVTTSWAEGHHCTFNSLYWDFCSASRIFSTLSALNNAFFPFNSLYWDFCSASIFAGLVAFGSQICFQFPLLGFLFCILHIM